MKSEAESISPEASTPATTAGHRPRQAVLEPFEVDKLKGNERTHACTNGNQNTHGGSFPWLPYRHGC